MRAVNLIPAEDRRGAGAPGRSGGAVYGVLGALGLVVIFVAVLFALSHQVKVKEDRLASVNQQAQQAEAQAGSLQAYTQFATLRETRQQTVSSLASSRFDWAHALHELARTVPAGTSLTGLRATVSPSVSVGGVTDPLRQSLSVPAIELNGCATSQDGVAEVLAAMRRIDGVQRVSLSSSERNSKGVGGASSGSSTPGAGSDCRAGSFKRASFSMTVFYDAPAIPAGATTGAPATGAPATGTAPATAAPAAGTTAPASTTTPASTTGGTK
jgi:Tfp pilus assembly protein PilN